MSNHSVKFRQDLVSNLCVILLPDSQTVTIEHNLIGGCVLYCRTAVSAVNNSARNAGGV